MTPEALANMAVLPCPSPLLRLPARPKPSRRRSIRSTKVASCRHVVSKAIGSVEKTWYSISIFVLYVDIWHETRVHGMIIPFHP